MTLVGKTVRMFQNKHLLGFMFHSFFFSEWANKNLTLTFQLIKMSAE